MYLSCFLEKGTRLEALFRFSVMWHLTREIQGSRVTSHNRSFDRYFPFSLVWTNVYALFCSFFWAGKNACCRDMQAKGRSSLALLLVLNTHGALKSAFTFLYGGSFCKNRTSFMYEE